MSANALMLAGWFILLLGVVVRIIGDRSVRSGIPDSGRCRAWRDPP